jgi:hypothetical protein
VTTEAEELHRIISASIRDMLDAFRIQASAGPVTDKALEEIIFRAAHGVEQSLAPYPGEQRVAMLPSGGAYAVGDLPGGARERRRFTGHDPRRRPSMRAAPYRL